MAGIHPGAGAQAGDLAVNAVEQTQAGDFDLALEQVGQVFTTSRLGVLGTEEVFELCGEIVLHPDLGHRVHPVLRAMAEATKVLR